MEIKSVLIICGDETDNFINKKVLEICGIWNVLFFSNPIIALDYLINETEHPDLIITDIYMGSMNGFQFVDKYCQMEKNKKKSRIAFLSVSLDPDDKEKANKRQLHFIEKPLSVKKFKTIFLPSNPIEKCLKI